VGFFFGTQFRGRFSVSADDTDFLISHCDGFVVFAEEGDADFTIFGDKKLGVGFHFGDYFSSVGSCDFFGVVVAFFFVFVFAFGVVMA